MKLVTALVWLCAIAALVFAVLFFIESLDVVRSR